MIIRELQNAGNLHQTCSLITLLATREDLNMTDSNKKGINIEKLKVEGSQLVDKVKEIINDSSARRVTIKKDDKTMLEVPLVVGVGGAAAAVLFAPVLAAVGAFAALVSDVDVIVERQVSEVSSDTEDSES